MPHLQSRVAATMRGKSPAPLSCCTPVTRSSIRMCPGVLYATAAAWLSMRPSSLHGVPDSRVASYVRSYRIQRGVRQTAATRMKQEPLTCNHPRHCNQRRRRRDVSAVPRKTDCTLQAAHPPTTLAYDIPRYAHTKEWTFDLKNARIVMNHDQHDDAPYRSERLRAVG